MGSTSTNVGLGFAGGGVAGGYGVGALTGSNPFGAGNTSRQQAGLNTGSNADETINGILQRIQSKSGTGTFNEGQLQQGILETKNLQDQLSSGKISQADYARITDSYLPQLQQFGNQMMQAGSAGANAARPFVTQLDNLYQDTQIYKAGQQFLGRDLTASELAQIKPSFQGPNGSINGNAYLANLASQYKSNPSLDPGKAVSGTDANGQVAQQFQSILGRAPTSDELSHFTTAIQSGQTDSYGLSSFLKQQPEYTNAQDATFRSGLNTELTGYDTEEFNREKGDVMSAYAARGINPGGSPSLDYALTDLMGNIASNRSSYLASLSASQYGGNKDLAIGNYQKTLDQMYGNNQTNTQNQANYGNSLLGRGFAGMDYQTQMNDYLNFMNQNKGRSSNPVYGALGGAAGAAIGAFGGPGGAQAGYNVGSGLGNYYGYLNR